MEVVLWPPTTPPPPVAAEEEELELPGMKNAHFGCRFSCTRTCPSLTLVLACNKIGFGWGAPPPGTRPPIANACWSPAPATIEAGVGASLTAPCSNR
mmetsp:Transcript_68120/g.142302  ORF Transcript_68120/g.142302 Transcript_68120/m.142302 type:complete len:97 (+) Transcript_68120:1158-1448(+)